MVQTTLGKWLQAWGYVNTRGALHLGVDDLPTDHPYRTELVELLDPHGGIRAQAVFDVEGVPTICFLEKSGGTVHPEAVFDAIRQRAWNQNLVSLILLVNDQEALAMPAALPKAQPEIVEFREARRFGRFSCADIQSGDVFSRHSDWFSPDDRVDRSLLRNLGVVVSRLEKCPGISKLDAQLLMAQVLFVAYLEHRGIVGETYRQTRQVGSLFDLIEARDHPGIVALMESLKDDFNGDLLGPKTDLAVLWNRLPAEALRTIDDFLSRVNLETGAQDFWNYDFRFIPVELISGIYESFLSDDKKAAGAYYTPRHLATLAVDQALLESRNILEEKIYDGACGSGILLTTAYRRMLAKAEADTKRQWSFKERIELLKGHIFGSDINRSACRVTAFSLYLSLLEGLQPADIAKLTEQGQSLLPEMVGSNILAESEGDFFSDDNPLSISQKFTLILSNPPWVEPSKQVVLSSDRWVEKSGVTVPRRQLSAAFMWRALGCLDPVKGRFCFILPVSVLGAPTSQAFVKEWLGACELHTLINFGDIRKLLFAEAKSPTLLAIGRPRQKNVAQRSPDTFQYWVPKADVSFAFGRLTLHATDRHQVMTQQLMWDNSVLTTLYWGTAKDHAMLGRLELHGKIGELFQEREGWRTSKGFHKHDASIPDTVSVAPIAELPHLDAKHFAVDGMLLDEGVLGPLPAELTEVARLPEEMIESFFGPRIVFKDGMTPDREICAAFSSQPFSFSSSIGVIHAPSEDAALLKFLAVYLHSDLVRYLLLLTAYQVAFERERVTLRDVKQLPFVLPSQHRSPERAAAILQEIGDFVDHLENVPSLLRASAYGQWKPRAEALVSEYFGLNEYERERVQEVVTLILPSVQPSSIEALQTPLLTRVSDYELQQYVRSLTTELSEWRDALGGEGNFEASIAIGSAQSCGAVGILRLDVVSEKQTTPPPVTVADDAVAALVDNLHLQQMLPVALHENLYLAADVVIHHDQSIYLVKPLVRRLWLQAEAYRDAERIVRSVQEVTSA